MNRRAFTPGTVALLVGLQLFRFPERQAALAVELAAQSAVA